MKVAMMQPTFLPWVGYFELISRADKFVFLDDFQFVHRSFDSRNRLFSSKGQVDWYSLQVDKKKGFRRPYNEVPIREDVPWRGKFWRKLVNNYGKAPYFSDYADGLEKLLLAPQYNLAQQNIRIILFLASKLGYEDKFFYSSQMKINGKRSSRILNIIKNMDADTYLSAYGSFGYMFEDGIFPANGIRVLFQNHIPKEYSQVGAAGKFEPYLSVLDLLCNEPVERAREIIETGTEKWLEWDEMVEREKANSVHCEAAISPAGGGRLRSLSRFDFNFGLALSAIARGEKAVAA